MMTSKVLLDRYALANPLAPRTYKKYGNYLNRFNAWFGGESLLTDLHEKVNEFILFRENTTAPETARDTSVVMLSLLQFAAKRGWVPWVDVRRVKVKEVNPKALFKQQIKKLFHWGTDFQRAAIRLAYDTGLRRSDLFAVTWSDVHEHTMRRNFVKTYFRIIVVQEKTGHVIERRVRPDTLELLKAIRIEGDDRLLPWKKCSNAWDEAWQKMAKLANVETHGLQDIRRTGASYCAKEGLSAEEYLDHRGGVTAKKYYIDRRIASRPGPMPPRVKFKDAAIEDDEPYEIASLAGLNRPHPRLLAGDED